MTARRFAPLHDLPMFPSEQEVARAMMGERADEWPDKAVILERSYGLPKIDPFMGGRPKPALENFVRVYSGLDHAEPSASNSNARVRIVNLAPDGPENPHGAAAQTHDHRRRTGQSRGRSGA